MFDLPEAKRIRREDLVSNSGSLSPDPEGYVAAALARLKDLFAIDGTQNVAGLQGFADETALAEVPVITEDAFEFRLFAAPKTDTEPPKGHSTARIAIRSPPPDNSLPGFLVASRPRSYYFTSSRTQEELERFRTVAISGQDIISESKRRWPGSELPWRLVTIKADGKGEFLGSHIRGVTAESRPGRRRDGKKRRIAVRKKLATIRAKREQEAMEKAMQEAAEKAKRTQRNRDKKVKKKARDKEKKASTPGLNVADSEKYPM